MAERNGNAKHNGVAIERAEAEGMGAAIGGLEHRSAEFSHFLHTILEEFQKVDTQFTLREIAEHIVEEDSEMTRFSDRIEGIKHFLKEYLGGETDAWHELEAEEARRQLRTDQTLGGTPG